MKSFIHTPSGYITNLFGRLQLTVTNLFFFVLAIFGFRPEQIKGVYDRGDTNEKRPSISYEQAAEYAVRATKTMKDMGFTQSLDGMFDCSNTARLKAEIINALASLDGLTGASIAGAYGYTRDVDGRGHEIAQIIYDGTERAFVEGHENHEKLRELSASELDSCEFDIIG